MEGCELDVDFESANRCRSPTKRTRSLCATIASGVAVILYMASIGVTCLLFGLLVRLYSSSLEDNYPQDVNLTVSPTYEMSIIGCSILVLLEILLVIFGTAGTVLGRR